jgi:ABC-type cobalt transport system substrate-binding protein
MQFLTRQKAGLYRLVLLFIGSCLCWMLLPMQARAATGIIADDAQVLNVAAIHQYTDPFSYTVDIFTTRAFQGSDEDFDASVKGLTSDYATPTVSPCNPRYQVGCQLFSPYTVPIPIATGTADASDTTSFSTRNSGADLSVEIGIDVPARHLAIYSGQQVTISQDHYNNAIQAFADTMHQTHDNYTQATIAALNALENATDRFWRAAEPWGLVALLIAVVIVFTVATRKGRWGSSDDDGDRYYRRRSYYNNYTPWNSGGGGGNSGGGGMGNGGGGGGASGNF